MAKLTTFQDVIEVCKTYLNSYHISMISKAYETAKAMHEGQFRKSGDPYIQHPIEVAYILATLHTGPSTIQAGLLHDVLEDTSMTKEEMINQFGQEVTDIVDGVTKISQLKYMTKSKALAHNHEKLLLAMAKDVRVILVKLVDRLHNMRTIDFQPMDKKLRISQETLDLYAPIAHRLGMYRIKAELEDLSFKALQPETYKEIANAIEFKKDQREDDIEFMKQAIIKALDDNGITHYEIKGRIKNIYSIHNKMVTKNKTIDDIYDLLALRVIVDTIGDCYRVLGIVHSIWNPLPKRFKDYIAVPKANLYQSLHTTVVGREGHIFELQIRTYEMDEVAELGVAAHWAYKENNGYSPEKEQLEITNKLKWFNALSTYVENSSNSDPINDIKDDIFSADVFVFSPTGDVYDLPSGSMPLDFAYRIHSEVGNRTVGAIVNGKIVPLSYKLQTGDVVEIKTSKTSTGPTQSWMKLAKTNHAKNKIRGFINKQKRDELTEKGREDLEHYCKQHNYDIKLIDDEVVKEHFSKLGLKTYDDLCWEIGKNTLSSQGVLNKIQGLSDVKMDDELALKQYSESSSENREHHHSKNDYGVIVEGLAKAQIKMANCCQPVLGDKIVGFISKGNGIIVHRANCPNVKGSERLITVTWDNEFNSRVYLTTLKLFARDRVNIVADMINAINNCNVTIISVTSSKNQQDECIAKFKLQVSNVDDLDKAILALQKMPEMYSVERMIK